MPVPLPRSRAVALAARPRGRAAALRVERHGIARLALHADQRSRPATPCSGSTARADGSLTPAGTFATGGAGSPRSAGARAPSSSATTALPVRRQRRLGQRVGVPHRPPAARLLDTVPRGGTRRPASTSRTGACTCSTRGGDAERRRVLRRATARSKAIRRHPRAAPGATGAAQVSVTPDGRSLVVTERSQPARDAAAGPLGRPGAPVVTPSSGAVPFGFAISPAGTSSSPRPVRAPCRPTAWRPRRAAHDHRVAARRPGRRLLGRRVAERALRLHRQRGRQHQRLRDRP